MTDPLISVIVPIYKSEQYLNRCVDSIVNQTYTNLEIILVDDGSPDKCGEICDAWAEKDSRIKVIHQANGGMSAARNAGLDISTGEWIGFVDSDDYIAPQMYEWLLSETTDENIGIVGGDWLFMSDKPHSFYGDKGTSLPRNISHTQIFEHILLDDCSCNVWSKLFKRCLFDDIRFKKGQIAEDLLINLMVAIRMIDLRLDMLEIPKILLYYTINNEGITNTFNCKQALHAKFAYYEATIDYISRYPKEKKNSEYLFHVISNLINFGIYNFYVTDEKHKDSDLKKEWLNYVRNIPFKYISLTKNEQGYKSLYKTLFLIKYFPSFYNLIKRIQMKAN